jgi:hypothetical protein
MPQVFSQPQVLGVKLLLLGMALAAAAGVAVSLWRMSGEIDTGSMPMQPIPFSHKHHAGDDGLDCRYCHASVEKAAFAGMPSTKICLTCHSQLYADAPALAPLHDSARTGMPIAWVRVYDLPDFVYFDHGIHVNKGVGCIECHGRVDRMPITRLAAPLTMQWCLGCHRDPAPHLRETSQVFTMLPTDALRKRDPAALARAHRVQDTRRLTDCSTCHR